MITADEARRKSIINTHAKQLMILCERNILEAADKGDYSTRVLHHYTAEKDRVIVDAVVTELCNLGYEVTTEWHKRNSSDPEHNVINISWAI